MSAKKRGLGRGLDALLEARKPDEGVTRLSIDLLRPNRL